MQDPEKRSSITEMPASSPAAHGVGGRHSPASPSPQGGGYQVVYTDSDAAVRAAADQRMNELREIGLSRVWLDVAEAIGIDAFLDVWQILDRENLGMGAERRELVRLYIPHFSTFLKFQRNRYIQTLAQQGAQAREISALIWHELREKISVRHVARLIARAKIRP